MRARAAGFITANLVCNAIWLAAGAHGYWWPKWVLLGTGIALVAALVHAMLELDDEPLEEEHGLPRMH